MVTITFNHDRLRYGKFPCGQLMDAVCTGIPNQDDFCIEVSKHKDKRFTEVITIRFEIGENEHAPDVAFTLGMLCQQFIMDKD